MRSDPWHLTLSALALAAMLSACTRWIAQEVPAPPASMRMMRHARVTLHDRSSLELVNVVIASDSLFGVGNDLARLRFAVPLQSITRIEEKRKSPTRTLLLLGGSLVFLFGFTDVFGGPFFD